MAGLAIMEPVSAFGFFEGGRRRDEAEAKKLRELERENTELKKMVAEPSLDVRMLKDLNSKKW
jgi:hypothetical protein